MNKLILPFIVAGLTYNTAFASSENGAAWAPDNKHLALHSNKEGGSHLFMVDTETLQWTQITDSGFNRYPSWSSDGKQLVFMSWQDNDEGFSTYIMNLEDRKVKRVSKDNKVHLGPVISPDGKKIAYCVGGKIPQIWLMDIDGSNATLLTNNRQNGCWPKWLPDNQTLIFGAPGRNASDDFDIASLNIKTREFTYLFESEVNDWGVTYSEQDNRIYFNSLKDSSDKNMMTGQWNIYSMTLSGKNVRKEIENSVFDSTIDVSKDGRNVAFATIENQDHKVKLLNMASQKVRSTSGD